MVSFLALVISESNFGKPKGYTFLLWGIVAKAYVYMILKSLVCEYNK